MRCGIFLLFLATFLASVFSRAAALSQQNPPTADTPSASQPGAASLKVSLRLEDESPFKGWATVHVLPTEGYEIAGNPGSSDGDLLFSHMQPGAYTVEAVAPGFLTVRLLTTINTPHQQRTLFIVMLPKLLPVASASTSAALPANTANPPAVLTSWLPQAVDETVPDIEPDVECPAQLVLHGVGQRMTQFINNLEKFSATERVEHFNVDWTGARRTSEVRDFDYVVTVSQSPLGMFVLDEFRNGNTDPNQFPAHIATDGLPAMALIFHPLLAGDFKFACEGLGQWKGKPAWQIHFLQRPDKQSRIRAYVIAARNYRIPLKGRVWIDPGTLQVLQLDSELVNPIKEIQLNDERSSIEYGLVQFHSQKQEIWLPQTADLWVERKGRRYYRRHTFSNFKVFSVDTTQNVQKTRESYTFTNTSDRDIHGFLTVKPAIGTDLDPVTISFTIPAGGSIFKSVGPGKDVNVPVGEIASAIFVHNGVTDAIKVDAHLLKESSVDVVADSPSPSEP